MVKRACGGARGWTYVDGRGDGCACAGLSVCPRVWGHNDFSVLVFCYDSLYKIAHCRSVIDSLCPQSPLRCRVVEASAFHNDSKVFFAIGITHTS